MKYRVVVNETRIYRVECVVEADSAADAVSRIEEDGATAHEVKDELVDVTNVDIGSSRN
jgi:hypothetical protein